MLPFSFRISISYSLVSAYFCNCAACTLFCLSSSSIFCWLSLSLSFCCFLSSATSCNTSLFTLSFMASISRSLVPQKCCSSVIRVCCDCISLSNSFILCWLSSTHSFCIFLNLVTSCSTSLFTFRFMASISCLPGLSSSCILQWLSSRLSFCCLPSSAISCDMSKFIFSFMAWISRLLLSEHFRNSVITVACVPFSLSSSWILRLVSSRFSSCIFLSSTTSCSISFLTLCFKASISCLPVLSSSCSLCRFSSRLAFCCLLSSATSCDISLFTSFKVSFSFLSSSRVCLCRTVSCVSC